MEIFAICETFKGNGFKLTLPVEYFMLKGVAVQRMNKLKGNFIVKSIDIKSDKPFLTITEREISEVYAVCKTFNSKFLELTLPMEYYYSENSALARYSELRTFGCNVLVMEIAIK